MPRMAMLTAGIPCTQALFQRCQEFEPDARPRMEEVQQELNRLLQPLQDAAEEGDSSGCSGRGEGM
jgi:hypothetical protein